MKIEWKDKQYKDGIIFHENAHWDGVSMRHYRVRPGTLIERHEPTHNLSVPIDGAAHISKHGASGCNRDYISCNKNICVLPATQPTWADWDEEIENVSFDLDSEFVRNAALEAHLSPDFEFTETYAAEDPLLRQLGLALLAESHNEASEGRLYADSLIHTLIFHLLKHYTTAGQKIASIAGGLPGYKLNRVKEFIHANLQEDLGLSDIAAAAGLSRFHFARAFRKSTGQTPQQYLTEQRIEHAKKLLAASDMPLVEISMQAGFKNQSHFTTLFRRLTNYTPKGWRELSIA